MDCTHCEPILLDLCYGELTPQHEREVRAHILECPTCRKALSRLEAGQALARHLPDEPPPPEMTEKILRAARAHLRQRGTLLERFQGVLESMARIAMTRQVAMATMSLVIVFVGLWSIPELTHRRDARSAIVTETTHDGEAGPSRDLPVTPQPAVAPVAAAAEPESKASHRLARRSASAGNQIAPKKAAGEVASKRAERAADRADKAKAYPASSAEGQLAQRPPPKGDVRDRSFAPPPSTERRAAAPLDPLALGAAAKTAGRASAPESDSLDGLSDDLVASKQGRPSAPASTAAPAPAAAPASTAATAPLREEQLRVARPATFAPVALEEVFQAGVERYRAEDYAAAAQLFARMLESSAPSAQRAAALLYLARSERALGRCERAIRAYETLVRSYGSAQQSAIALSEGVACFDQIGDAAGAQRLLEHAMSVPSLSAQAQKTISERSSSEKAADAPVAAPAQAPAKR
jgi:TolA-binding protein